MGGRECLQNSPPIALMLLTHEVSACSTHQVSVRPVGVTNRTTLVVEDLFPKSLAVPEVVKEEVLEDLDGRLLVHPSQYILPV